MLKLIRVFYAKGNSQVCVLSLPAKYCTSTLPSKKIEDRIYTFIIISETLKKRAKSFVSTGRRGLQKVYVYILSHIIMCFYVFFADKIDVFITCNSFIFIGEKRNKQIK